MCFGNDGMGCEDDIAAVERVERAVSLFEEGFSCSQAVLGAYSERFGLACEAALKLSAGFGGGMKMAGTCGAVTGALMVIGLKHGHSDAADKEGKRKVGALIKDFVARFKERNYSLTCKELLGCDISTPQGKQEAEEKNLTQTICPKYVHDAARILDEMLSLDGNYDSTD